MRYLQFLEFYIELKHSLILKLSDISKLSSSLSFSKLLKINTDLIDSWLEDVSEKILFKSRPEFYEKMTIEEKSNFEEITHNCLRGRQNDAVFALLRSINISQKNSINSNTNIYFQQEELKNNITESFNCSGLINSLDYALDNLSYSTWKVSKIINNKKTIFWFDFVDKNYIKSRDLGLRRMFINKIIGSKRQSWLAEELRPIGYKALEKAWCYYNNGDFNCKKFLKLKTELGKELEQLELEDELLVAFGASNNITSLYSKSVVLIAYITVMNFMNLDDFPIEQIKNNLNSIYANGECIGDDIDFALSILPIKNHIELLSKPLILSNANSVHHIKYIGCNHWVQWVRNSCMKGGTIANKVGKAWEKFAKYTFERNNWNVVGSSIEIKEGKNKITDIDLLIEKDSILFIIQMKTFYTVDFNEYSQWKSKEKLRKAAKQLKAVDLRMIEDKLSNIGKTITIDNTFPIILTNLHLYNGWNCDGARVVSFYSLSQFFNGAAVDFVRH